MSDQEKLTKIDGPMLAAAFPIRHRLGAIAAGDEVARLLAPRQSTVRFSVRVEAETVLIPARLNFVSNELALLENEQAWRFARALHTRSNDGFERQRAARDLLNSMESWAAPFIVALMGEYIVEILEDIADALTPELENSWRLHRGQRGFLGYDQAPSNQLLECLPRIELRDGTTWVVAAR